MTGRRRTILGTRHDLTTVAWLAGRYLDGESQAKLGRELGHTGRQPGANLSTAFAQFTVMYDWVDDEDRAPSLRQALANYVAEHYAEVS